MAKADEKLLQRLRDAPKDEFSLILRVSGDVATAAEKLGSTPVEVRRILHLIGAVAVRARGSEALRLMDTPWVVRVEEDSPVRAFS